MNNILTTLTQLPVFAYAGILFALGLVGVGVYYTLRSRNQPPPPEGTAGLAAGVRLDEVAPPAAVPKPKPMPVPPAPLPSPAAGKPAGAVRPSEAADPIGWYEHYSAELEEAQAGSLTLAPAAPAPPATAGFSELPPGVVSPMPGQSGGPTEGEDVKEAPLDHSQAESAARPAAAPPGGAPGVVSIVPDSQMGEVVIVVDGRRYASLLEVPEDQRPQVVRAVDNLIAFGLKTTAASPIEAPAAPRAAPTLRLETGMRTITPRPALQDSYEEARKRHERIKRISSLAGSLIPGPPEPATPAFFEAINAILARRIEENDELRGRRVIMRTNPQGDLQVLDGTQIFPSVDEVADDVVRALIKASIAEWEGQS